MVKFAVTTRLECSASLYITDKDTAVYKKFHMEKLGTLESEVLSEQVFDGPDGPVVKTVVRTVPGMKLPRIVRPILRGKEVEFRDTRTFSLGAKGRLPFAQTFHTVNNITDRAVVEGRITIDSTEDGTATTLHVEGECVVKISGLGGKVENIIVENLKNAYRKLPDIVDEWMSVRHVLLAQAGAPAATPGGGERVTVPMSMPPMPSPAETVRGRTRRSGASAAARTAAIENALTPPQRQPAPGSTSSESPTGSFQSATSDMEEGSSFGRSVGSVVASGAGGASFVPAIPPPPATPTPVGGRAASPPAATTPSMVTVGGIGGFDERATVREGGGGGGGGVAGFSGGGEAWSQEEDTSGRSVSVARLTAAADFSFSTPQPDVRRGERGGGGGGKAVEVGFRAGLSEVLNSALKVNEGEGRGERWERYGAHGGAGVGAEATTSTTISTQQQQQHRLSRRETAHVGFSAHSAEGAEAAVGGGGFGGGGDDLSWRSPQAFPLPPDTPLLGKVINRGMSATQGVFSGGGGGGGQDIDSADDERGGRPRSARSRSASNDGGGVGGRSGGGGSGGGGGGRGGERVGSFGSWLLRYLLPCCGGPSSSSSSQEREEGSSDGSQGGGASAGEAYSSSDDEWMDAKEDVQESLRIPLSPKRQTRRT